MSVNRYMPFCKLCFINQVEDWYYVLLHRKHIIYIEAIKVGCEENMCSDKNCIGFFSSFLIIKLITRSVNIFIQGIFTKLLEYVGLIYMF